MAVDLRVDDHPDPIEELERIYHFQQLYFGETQASDIIPIDGDVKVRMIQQLHKLEYLSSLDASENEFQQAFTTYLHTENFEGCEQQRGYIGSKGL